MKGAQEGRQNQVKEVNIQERQEIAHASRWEEHILTAVCPVCEAEIRLSEDDRVLYDQLRCSNCGTFLRAVEEASVE